MLGDFYEQELIAIFIYGFIINFIFSLLFGFYLAKNIGTEEMIMSKGEKEQPAWMGVLLFIPFAKMALTLYRVAILQLYFLNRGKSHKDYWVYLTS